jgi:type IV fimbrial biogenesis protein FimT
LTNLRFARNHSVSHHATVSLCPSDDGDSCSGNPFGWQDGYLVFIDSNRNRSRETGETLLRVATQGTQNLQLHSTAGRPAIRFDPDGAAWGSNTTFSICIAGSSVSNRAIILHGTGRARSDRRKPNGDEVTCT